MTTAETANTPLLVKPGIALGDYWPISLHEGGERIQFIDEVTKLIAALDPYTDAINKAPEEWVVVRQQERNSDDAHSAYIQFDARKINGVVELRIDHRANTINSTDQPSTLAHRRTVLTIQNEKLFRIQTGKVDRNSHMTAGYPTFMPPMSDTWNNLRPVMDSMDLWQEKTDAIREFRMMLLKTELQRANLDKVY
jgi:hypothetical protein